MDLFARKFIVFLLCCGVVQHGVFSSKARSKSKTSSSPTAIDCQSLTYNSCPPGEVGAQGPSGKDGDEGPAGEKGEPATCPTVCRPGIRGSPGRPGDRGQTGRPGRDGLPGKDCVPDPEK